MCVLMAWKNAKAALAWRNADAKLQAATL